MFNILHRELHIWKASQAWITHRRLARTKAPIPNLNSIFTPWPFDIDNSKG